MVKTVSRTERSIRMSSIDFPVYAELADRMVHVLYYRAGQELENITGTEAEWPQSPLREKGNLP